MATSVTSLNQTFVEGAIAEFNRVLAPLSAFSLQWSDAALSKDDTMVIAFVNTGSTSHDFNYTTGYNLTTGSIAGKSITLDKWQYQTWDITDSDYIKLGPATVAQLGSQLGAQLAYDVMAGVLDVVTTASYSSAAQVGAAFTASAVRNVMITADTAKWPATPRSLVLNASQFGYLAADSALNAAYAFGGAQVIQGGNIPEVYGFKVMKATAVPSNDGSNVAGFACNPNGLLVGMATPAPQPGHNYSNAYQVVHEGGAKLGYREWYEPSKGKLMRVIECLYGVAVGNPNALIIVKSA